MSVENKEKKQTIIQAVIRMLIDIFTHSGRSPDGKHVMNKIKMETYQNNTLGGLIDVTDDGYILVAKNDKDYFRNRITEDERHIDPKILQWFLSNLGDSSGKKLADIMGYKAFNRNGSGKFDVNNRDNFISEDIEIGRMLLPNTNGFSLTLSSSSSKKLGYNIKFMFFGINGAAHKEFVRSVSQKIPLSNISTQLTVHVVSKVVRFQNDNGDYFYWRKIENLGDFIDTIKIENKYIKGTNGYEEVKGLYGNISRVSTIDYKKSREHKIEIKENKSFNIGCEISEKTYVNGSLGISGEFQLVESFCLNYIVPPGRAYIVNDDTILFQNIWAERHNKTLQLTQKASFVLCIALRFIITQNKGHFSVS